MEKYHYKYIQRLNGKHEKKETCREPQYKNGNYQKKDPNRSYRMKITVFKLKILRDVRKSIRQCKGKDQ